MKIAISPEIFGLQRFGGISRYFVELHSALLEAGIDASIYAGVHINALLQPHTSVRGRLMHGSRVRRIRRRLNEWAFRMWCASQESGLVVHRTYYSATKRPKCRRLVTTIHDLIPEMFPERPGETDAASIQKRQACEDADAICVNSETTASDLRRLWGVPQERIWVTPLGVKPAKSSGRPWRKELGNYILHVGLRHGYKNGAALFEAFAASGLSSRLQLMCFGGGPFTSSEVSMLERLGIVGRVQQHTGDDADLAACYEQAIGFLCPSRYEGFGLPVLEAMAHGCPVACSQAGALPEVAGEGAVYFDPDRIDSIASAIHEIAEGRMAVGARLVTARARVERFTWSRTAEATQLAYQGSHR
jgi:glycosyltransferase involved in cell wall biosynthesis